MKKICFLLIIACVFLSCEDTKTSTPTSGESQKTNTTKTLEKEKEKEKEKEEKHVFISTENVLDYMIAYGKENKVFTIFIKLWF